MRTVSPRERISPSNSPRHFRYQSNFWRGEGDIGGEVNASGELSKPHCLFAARHFRTVSNDSGVPHFSSASAQRSL
jgi:hypothetical protein